MTTSRPACAAVGALLLALALAACGGSNPTTDANAGAAAGATQPGGAPRVFLHDPKVVACLKREGVTIPSRPRGADGGPPGGPNGQPPSGQDGQPPSGQDGQPPSGQGAPNGGAGSAQSRSCARRCRSAA